MKPHTYFLFDGSFAGFLNAIQRGFEESHNRILFNPSESTDTLPLFGPGVKIETDTRRAKRLWEDLGLLGTEIQKRVYYSFLHENAKLQSEIYQYVAYLFCPDIEGIKPLGIQAGKLLEKAVREVTRERREQERKLNFRTHADGLWYSEVRPKHNILPLLSRYCRSRFPSDPWFVVDTGRKKSLSALSGKLTLTPCLEHTQQESNTLKRLHREVDTTNDVNTSWNATPDYAKITDVKNRRTQKWGADWGQQAV